MSSEKSNPAARGRAALDQGAGSSGGKGQSGAEVVVAKRSQPLPLSLSLPSVPGTTHLFECKCKLLIQILEDISSQLAELNQLREKAERKKERDKVGSRK